MSGRTPAPPRRVVTGHDGRGRAIVVSDRPAKTWQLGERGFELYDLWRTTETPALLTADEPDPVEVPLDFDINTHGARMRMLDIPVSPSEPAPWMHRTNSIDYGYIISGEVVLLLDDSEVTLGAGDIFIQRGTNHAWVNRGPDRCRMLVVMIGAEFAPEIADVAELYSAQALTQTLSPQDRQDAGEKEEQP